MQFWQLNKLICFIVGLHWYISIKILILYAVVVSYPTINSRYRLVHPLVHRVKYITNVSSHWVQLQAYLAVHLMLSVNNLDAFFYYCPRWAKLWFNIHIQLTCVFGQECRNGANKNRVSLILNIRVQSFANRPAVDRKRI